MANIQGVIAGISIDKSNEIKPSFDAMVYDFIIGQDGHALAFSTSGTTLTVNGFAVANGIRGFFENAQITIATNGYLYVLFTTHQSASVADTVELEWSATSLTETHDNIGSVAGIYRMKVLTVESGTATVNNKIEKVLNTEEAETVTTTIAENATATTQATTDNSTKVATTEFVQNAISAKFDTFATAVFTPANGVTLSTNSVRRQGKLVVFSLFAQHTGSATIPAGDPIATLPVNFRPAETLNNLVSYGDDVTLDTSLYIGTDGVLRAGHNYYHDAFDSGKIKLFNIGFVAAT